MNSFTIEPILPDTKWLSFNKEHMEENTIELQKKKNQGQLPFKNNIFINSLIILHNIF